MIFDSSPLITLASFPIDRAAIEDVLALANIIVVEAVASETTTRSKYRDAQVLRKLYSSNAIEQQILPVSLITDNLLRAYNKLGSGEIETIKLALSLQNKTTVVMDDEAAFVVAHHFGLQPVMLLDLLSKWVVNGTIAMDDAILRSYIEDRALLTGETADEIAATVDRSSFYQSVYALHQRFTAGEFSLGYMADTLSISKTALYHLLDAMGLKVTNV